MELKGPEPIAPHHVVVGFESGLPVLDGWLVARALKNERDGGSRTYVASVVVVVIGCYCLSAGSVMHRVAPGRIRRNMPDPIPVVLMGLVEVAQPHQGRGIARASDRNAILCTVQAAEMAGIRVLLGHALDEDAAVFYRHLGFVGLAIDPLVLMLPGAMARRSFEC
jgi:GNAT superfamily N-acetyltransferase